MTKAIFPFFALALTASAVGAHAPQTDRRSAADAAKAFSLDLPSTVATPDPASVTSDPATPPMALAVFTLDTPIGQLIADPRAKAVLDKDLPGLSGDSNLAKFQTMSLRQFQPMTGGQMSDALLAKTGTDLATAGSSIVPVTNTAPALPVASKNRDSGR